MGTYIVFGKLFVKKSLYIFAFSGKGLKQGNLSYDVSYIKGIAKMPDNKIEIKNNDYFVSKIKGLPVSIPSLF